MNRLLSSRLLRSVAAK